MKRTTSIPDRQFEELTELVFQELAGTADGGQVLVLTLHDQVPLAVSYLRVNVSQAFLGQIFGVSQSTASRVMIDGTLLPCWSWQDAPELYSGKHHTTGHNAQVVSDLTGRLIYLSAPLPGNTHDTNAMRQLDLATLLTSISTGNAIGDKGYQGCNIITPAKKPQGRELTDDRKANNTIINRMRATIERVIANINLENPAHRLPSPQNIPNHTRRCPRTNLLLTINPPVNNPPTRPRLST